jgi:hypothetical protein
VSYDGVYEDSSLPDCCAVQSVIIALMMEASNTSKTSVNACKTTQRNNPEY